MAMERPDDAVIRIHVQTFALVRRLLPIALLVGSFAGPMYVAEPRVAMWYSAALFAASLFGLWTLEGLPLYPAHTFGIEYRFEDEPLGFESESGTGSAPDSMSASASVSASEGRYCVHCEEPIDDGVHRRYARQFVLLGVPIYTFAWGENDICRDCLEAAAYRARDTARARRGAGRGRRERSSGPRGSREAAASDGESTARADADPDRAAATEPSDDATPTADTESLRRRRDGPETDADPEPEPETETAIVRRVDLNDEVGALEVKRAFEGATP